MNNTLKFNPKNRMCIANGAEGCPACITSMHNLRETESFATLPEGMGEITETVMGLCLITNSEIAVGGKCDVDDDKFTTWSSK